MREKQVFYDYITVFDSEVFTRKKAAKWALNLLNAYDDVYKNMRSQLNEESPVSFHISRSLLWEVVVDAVIGMRKITQSVEYQETRKALINLAFSTIQLLI